jgi:hypothetical protein
MYYNFCFNRRQSSSYKQCTIIFGMWSSKNSLAVFHAVPHELCSEGHKNDVWVQEPRDKCDHHIQ